MPAEMQALMAEFADSMGQIEYLDLSNPTIL